MTWSGTSAELVPLLDASPVAMWLTDAATGEVLAANALGRRLDSAEGELATTTVELDGRAAELHVAVGRSRANAIVDGAADAILTVDVDGVVEWANPAAERLFSRPPGELVGRPVGEVVLAADERLPHLSRSATGVRPDGTTFPLELSVTDIDLGDRTLSTVVARDLTDRRTGTHDPLTGLPNRLLFLERLEAAVARAARSGRPVAVLFCDLDRFKVVNDSLGHAAGDELLMAVAARFRSAVRAGDTVARFGGDEFVVLAEDLTDEAGADRVAEQLQEALAAPVPVAGQEWVVGASIGIAVASGTASPEDLVRDADAAMYRAKETGRGHHERFDLDLRRRALARLDTETALRRALRDEAFEVHYQPEVALVSGAVVGVEALVRWRRSDGSLTQPIDFLAVAEETGLIVPIGEAVLVEACRRAASWHRLAGDGAPTLWVNISARQLASPGLAATLEAVVEAELPSASALGIEITETDLVPDDESTARAVHALADLGVRIAMDDFGTGYASLSYLWRFPAEVVKIDRSFVARLGDERDATVIITSMVDLARSLGKTTVAEGVERPDQLARLRRMGCDAGQGFLLGRPGPAEAIDALLHRPSEATAAG